jgi:putative membrane protein
MSKNKNNLVLFARIFLFVIYLVGLIGLNIASLRELYVQLTPVTLLVSAMILLAFHYEWNVRSIVVFVSIALAGFLVEWAGVQTGHVFGDYSYGSTLGPAAGGVPLIIGINWLILIYTTYHIASRLFRQGVIRILITAVMMVAFDYLMEPVAIGLDMWQWAGEGIPLMNYGAWFVVSLVFASALYLGRVRIHNPVADYLLLFMAVFFGILNFTI